ncbi:hypothetical protein CSC3H3_02585 [Thalassospira marina]|uniref:Uncharacterized protein n=1 Tax=Thalassospira marina TaxID=2048283 RepID=A0ABM6Q5E3_9PROT|nr:hypothetical protein CSC3H3_02585 [Thalassospira marina]
MAQFRQYWNCDSGYQQKKTRQRKTGKKYRDGHSGIYAGVKRQNCLWQNRKNQETLIVRKTNRPYRCRRADANMPQHIDARRKLPGIKDDFRILGNSMVPPGRIELPLTK